MAIIKTLLPEHPQNKICTMFVVVGKNKKHSTRFYTEIDDSVPFSGTLTLRLEVFDDDTAAIIDDTNTIVVTGAVSWLQVEGIIPIQFAMMDIVRTYLKA